MNHLTRRNVLRGLGASIAIPAMSSLPTTVAFAGSGAAPKRMAFIFVPNGIHMPDWKPQQAGADFQLPYILEPLQRVKDDLLVLTGLTHDKGRANSDGPGDHARSASVFLTGAQPRKTSAANIRSGVSVDQVAARHLGRYTKFASLELGCDRGANAGNCDSGYSCAYSSNVSWRSPSQPMSKEVNPRLVFERLFGDRSDSTQSAQATSRRQFRASILDFVAEDARSLKNRLATSDQRKLDEYLSGIREIEQRIQRAGKNDIDLSGFETPDGVPESYQQHIRLMCDMMVLAFQADLTRVATCMFANAGSNRSYKVVSVPDGHHDLSHHGNDPIKHGKIRRINRFHTTQLGYLLERLKSVREADGSSLLENSMIVYGSGLSDGNRHNNENLPVILAGQGGGTVHTGRHIEYEQETPMCNLFVSMLERVGASSERMGDATGSLPYLS